MPAISMVLPVYNEEKNLDRVLKFIKTLEFIDEVIIVDDGSSDSTADIVHHNLWNKARFIQMGRNVGKTWAVKAGVLEAKYEHILMFDGDLQGLNKADIKQMVDRYFNGADMVIMNYGVDAKEIPNRLLGFFPALSGVRLLSKKRFNEIQFQESDRFEIETRINDYFFDRDLEISIVNSKNLRSPIKYEKYSVKESIKEGSSEIKQVIFVNGVSGIGLLLYRWWRLRRLGE